MYVYHGLMKEAPHILIPPPSAISIDHKCHIQCTCICNNIMLIEGEKHDTCMLYVVCMP